MDEQGTLFEDMKKDLDRFHVTQIRWDAGNVDAWCLHHLNMFIKGYAETIKDSESNIKSWIGDDKKSIYIIFENAYFDILQEELGNRGKEFNTEELEQILHKRSKIVVEAYALATKTTSDILISLGKRQMYKNPHSHKNAFALPREVVDKIYGRGAGNIERLEDDKTTGNDLIFRTKDTKTVYDVTSKDIKTIAEAEQKIIEALGAKGKQTISALSVYARENRGFRQENVKLKDLMKLAGYKSFSQNHKREFTKNIMSLDGLAVRVETIYKTYWEFRKYIILNVFYGKGANKKDGTIDDSVLNVISFELFPNYHYRAELRGRLFSRNIIKLRGNRDAPIVNAVPIIQLQIDQLRTGKRYKDDNAYIVRTREWLIEVFDLVDLESNNKKEATRTLNSYIKRAIETENLLKCEPEKITAEAGKKYKIYGAKVSYDVSK